ncbi:MAG: hypothetical protein KDF65_07295, partial [Anaerolineae bacterium]|nr:hypothetical protein [Anaerolineae bacterium]
RRPKSATPESDVLAPYFLAYHEHQCEYLNLECTIERAIQSGRQVVSTGFIIPYPPGFPILVPGQVISQEILDFLKALDVKEIHGYRPDLGLRVFTEAALQPAAKSSAKLALSTNGGSTGKRDGQPQKESVKEKNKEA